MPKLKVSLSIGYNGAKHRDVLDIDDDDYNSCESDEEREALINEVALDWAWNYIDIGAEIVEE